MPKASVGLATISPSTGRRLIGNVRREVDRLSGVYTRTLERTGVTRFLTRAVLEDANTVRLAERDGTHFG